MMHGHPAPTVTRRGAAGYLLAVVVAGSVALGLSSSGLWLLLLWLIG